MVQIQLVASGKSQFQDRNNSCSATQLTHQKKSRLQYFFNRHQDLQADVIGPVQTPYEGGVFRCKLVIQNDFPNNPPKGKYQLKGYFLTKIFHPNVSQKGQICVNTLKKDWNPNAWSLYNIFEVIKCLLIVPFPESALNEQAGKLFMQDYESYFKHAKIVTEVYACEKQQKIQKQKKSILSQNNNEQNEEKVSPIKKDDKKKWIKRL